MNNLQFQLQHYIAEMWRRRWSILLVIWAVGLLGAFLAAKQSDVYTSRATVFVDTRSLMRVVLKDNFAIQDPTQQIENVRRMMYARPNLEEVIRRTDLDLELKDQRDWESMIASLEKKMTLQRQGRDFYRIEYEHGSPDKAQAVVQTLLDLFLEEGLVRGSGVNNMETEATRRYLENQRDDLQTRLEGIDARMADFERDNREELAGAPAVASEKRGLEAQLAQLQSDRLLYQQELSSLRARLSTIKQQIILRYKPAPQRTRTPEPPPSRQKVPVPTESPTLEEQRFQSVQGQFSQIQGELNSLLDRLTPQHPDVQAVQRRVDAARGQVESARAQAASARAAQQQRVQEAMAYNAQVDREYEAWRYRSSLPVAQAEPEPIYGPNPEYSQLRSDIDQRRNRLTVTEQKIDDVRKAVTDLQSTLSRQPEILQVYDKLQDDRGKYGAEYERVVEKVEELKIASDPNRLNFVEFRVVEPPQAPVTPTGPNRLMLFMAAAMLAAGAGLGLAFLRIQLTDNMPTITHLKQAFDLPILGGVSMIEPRGANLRGLTMNLAFAACLAAFVTLFAFVTYRYHFELWRPDVGGIAQMVRAKAENLF